MNPPPPPPPCLSPSAFPFLPPPSAPTIYLATGEGGLGEAKGMPPIPAWGTEVRRGCLPVRGSCKLGAGWSPVSTANTLHIPSLGWNLEKEVPTSLALLQSGLESELASQSPLSELLLLWEIWGGGGGQVSEKSCLGSPRSLSPTPPNGAGDLRGTQPTSMKGKPVSQPRVSPPR